MITKVAANGAVATTSMLFIVEAVGLGIFLKYTKFNKWINTAVAILLLVAAHCTWIAVPNVCKPWNMACDYLCIYYDCQCCSGMGIASAKRLFEQLPVDFHDCWCSCWCFRSKSCLQSENIYKL